MDWRTATIGYLHRQAFALRLAGQALYWPRAIAAHRPESRAVRLSGFLSEALGIGSAADLTRSALSALGYEVISEDIRPLQRNLLSRQPSDFAESSDARLWIIHANPPEARMVLFARAREAWQDLYRIGYWTWESSLAPRAWLDTAKWFHEIWVPSPFVRDALALAFADSPWPEQADKLRIMPHPVPPSARLHRHDTNVTALTLFDPRSDPERKNPDGAIRAWLAAFPAPGQARLIVKTLPVPGDRDLIDNLRALAGDRPDIEFRLHAHSRSETDDLIAGSDILLSLHRAEGFGLTLAEAMAMGVAVVATGWSGNMAYMTEENALPVSYRLVSANRRHNGPEAQWAEPDIAAAASALQRLAGAPGLRATLGTKARSDIAALMAPWRNLRARDGA